MIDFPNSPTVGQIFTVGSQTWQWDGIKWIPVTPITVLASVGRNYIHNSLFNIAQRGAGTFTANGYTLDRWGLSFVGGTASIQQSATSDAAKAAIGDEAAAFVLLNTFTGGASAGQATAVYQCIEGVRRLAGKTVTISFWAAATSGVLKLGISFDQNFGTGGSPSTGIFGTGQSVTLTTSSIPRYSLTFSIPSAAGKTLGTNNNDFTQLIFWYSAEATNNSRTGSVGVQSGNIYIWGVQLEIGSVATPLEKPDPQQDLANCQRFYQKQIQALVIGYASGAGYSVFSCFFLPVAMRSAPTMAFANTTYGNGNTLQSNGTNSGNIVLTLIAAATGLAYANTDILLSADL
jgi:hypothetical protein